MKKRLFLLSAAILLAGLLLWIAWGNTAPEISVYGVSSPKLPHSFSGFRIAQVSDLHNAEFGGGNEKLLSLLRQSKPDIIVITGDLVDSYRTDVDLALRFVREAVRIAPCYYVTGNHEARISQYGALLSGLEAAGVHLLDNARATLERGGETVTLLGAADPSFQTNYLLGDSAAVMTGQLAALTADTEGYTVLLSHRPELFDVYAESGVDLVFSGHAHGGQFRLPLIGGLAAPNQGLFPKYDAGLYTAGDTRMVVSRGLGNSIFPFRFNNRPELIIVQLENEKTGT